MKEALQDLLRCINNRKNKKVKKNDLVSEKFPHFVFDALLFQHKITKIVGNRYY
jgi:hypothetical protein